MQINYNSLCFADPLQLLERMDAELVTLAYVDPPYSLNTDFVYGTSNSAPSLEQIQGSWEYIAKLLQQIHRVLNNSGNLFFVDYPKSPFNCRLILDRIFGKENLRGEYIWRYSRGIGALGNNSPDYVKILHYSKDDNLVFNRPIRYMTEDEIRHDFQHQDKQGRYRLASLTTSVGNKPDMEFEWNGIVLPKGQTWRFSKPGLNELEAKGLLFYGKRKTPKRKIYLESKIVEVGYIWDDVTRYDPHKGKTFLKSADQKTLVERIVEMGSNEGNIVLIPFAGTGQDLINISKVHRRWIGCSNHDLGKILSERLKRSSGLELSLDYQILGEMEILDNPIIESVSGLPEIVRMDFLSYSKLFVPSIIRKRWALLVGINRYVDQGITSLRYCVADVLRLELMLKNAGYEVITLHDEQDRDDMLPTRANIENELSRLAHFISPDDLLFVHFSSHGVRMDNESLLITRDTRITRLARTALSVRDVESLMRESAATRFVVTLDVCQAGIEMGREVIHDAFISNVYDLAEGFALLAASTAQQVAREPEELEGGLFSHFLNEGLIGTADRDGKHFVTVEDLHNFTLDKLREWNLKHGTFQEPTYRIEGMGDMILVDRRRRL